MTSETKDRDREPTTDEAAGIAWWNGLSEADRAAWMERAGSAVPADAWAAFKQEGPTPAKTSQE